MNIRPIQFRFSVVGSGNLAQALIPAFVSVKLQPVQWISRDPTRLFDRFPELAKQFQQISHWNDPLLPADLLLIALTDDKIETYIKEIRNSLPPHLVLVHSSGSVPIDVLATETNPYGVFYCLQTFTTGRPVSFSDIPIFVEGSEIMAEQLLLRIGDRLSRKVYLMDSEHRKMLHLGAIFASNFVNYLLSCAGEIVESAGFDHRIYLPLIREVIQKLEILSPREAQTGPAKRNDTMIIQQHLSALESKPELQQIYQILTQAIQKHQ
ncbi:MAG: DUF2520 domain-containing protein [Bacteroidia bacterium]|nr:DUF2520 domain-containing protein [Bacteroidia bacterium]